MSKAATPTPITNTQALVQIAQVLIRREAEPHQVSASLIVDKVNLVANDLIPEAIGTDKINAVAELQRRYCIGVAS